MPFETEVQPLEPEAAVRFNKPEGQDASFWPRLDKQVRAAFSLENTVGSALADRGLPDQNLGQTDPLAAALFDREEFLTPEEKGYSDRFDGARSFRDIEAIRLRIADEKVAKETMASGPLPEWLVGTIAAVVDPTTVIPVAGPLIKGGRAAVALGSFARVGASAAAGAGVQEAILQGTQVSRTMEESAASVLGALILGGVIGSAAGTLGRREIAQFTKQMETVRKQVESDIVQVLRASNLGDLPPPKAGFLDTTAVGRFLDSTTAPDFVVPRNNIVKATDNDVLNYIAETQPKLLDEVSRLATDIQKADDRISKLEADPTTPVTRPVVPRDKATRDLMEALAKEGTPEAKAQLASIQESLQPKVTLNRLKRENEDLLADWEAAETRLAKTIEKAKAAMAEIEQNLGNKGRAEANLEIARMQAQFEKELAEGRDPLKLYPQGDPLDWLRGFARYPGEKKVSANVETPSSSKVPAGTEQPAPKDASSAATGPGAPASEFVARLRKSAWVAEITAKLSKIGLASPSLYMSTSMFETSRKVINRFAYTGLLLDDHYKGARHADDFETEVKILGQPAVMQVQKIADTAWSDYKQAMKAADAPVMTRGQLYEAIATAMTENDVGAHKIITDAAKAYRVIDKHFADLATEWGVGVFKNPEAVAKSMKGKSHLQRVWHTERIKANPVGFKELVKDWLARTSEKTMDAGWMDEVADDVVHKILGHPEGRLPPEINVKEGRGAARERTFEIPDNWRTADGRYGVKDFVDRNIINVMARYSRTMAADIAYQKILGGDEGVDAILKQLRDEASDMQKAMAEKQEASMGKGEPPKAGALEKKNLEIEKMYERDKSTIEMLVHRIRGTDPSGAADPRYLGARTVSKVIRDVNVPVFMGSSLVSQLPDLAKMVMTEGLMRSFGSLIGDFADGFKQFKIGLKEAQRIGTADDMVLGGRAGQIADISEQYTRQSKVEMATGLIANKALLLFGVSPWNTFVKGRASYLGADTILRSVQSMAEGKPLSKSREAYMRAIGIGDYEVEQIMKEQKIWGESTRGLLISNADQWKNLEAKNAFERALLRYIDGNVLTPGATDRPLWTQSEVGKALTQFQGFGFAAHQRILVAGLQQRDANALSSMIAMIGLGMTSVALRDIIRDGKVDDKRDARSWVRDGVDRSGVLSRVMELDTIIGKATGVNIQRKLTGEDASRFQGRSLVGQLGGPTAATIDGTARALRGLADGTVSGADVHAIRRTIPLQNFLGTKWLFDKVEEGIVDQYGLEPRQTPR